MSLSAISDGFCATCLTTLLRSLPSSFTMAMIPLAQDRMVWGLGTTRGYLFAPVFLLV
jgi:hypothetical protein